MAIKKFESLINVYICYVFEKEIKGSVNVHDNDSLNINFKDLEDDEEVKIILVMKN